MNHPKKIEPIDQSSVHRICSGQVVLDLATAVKELVENALDAKASESIEVTDNGTGIDQCNHEALCVKHTTSKLRSFADLLMVTSFGFRGEALSSLCAVGKVTVLTRTAEMTTGFQLEYDHEGSLVKSTPIAREQGTTILVQNLFEPLPVRHQDFMRHLKREYSKLQTVLQAYALISVGVKFRCVHTAANGSSSLFLSTNGTRATAAGADGATGDTRRLRAKQMRENVAAVFGAKFLHSLRPVDDSDEKSSLFLSGFVTKIDADGRGSTDRQFFFINRRPVDFSKATRVINEAYRACHKKHFPAVILNLDLAPDQYDVNVVPNKRQVLLHAEEEILNFLRGTMQIVYRSADAVFQQEGNQIMDHGGLSSSQFSLSSSSSSSTAVTAAVLSGSLSAGSFAQFERTSSAGPTPAARPVKKTASAAVSNQPTLLGRSTSSSGSSTLVLSMTRAGDAADDDAERRTKKRKSSSDMEPLKEATEPSPSSLSTSKRESAAPPDDEKDGDTNNKRPSSPFSSEHEEEEEDNDDENDEEEFEMKTNTPTRTTRLTRSTTEKSGKSQNQSTPTTTTAEEKRKHENPQTNNLDDIDDDVDDDDDDDDHDVSSFPLPSTTAAAATKELSTSVKSSTTSAITTDHSDDSCSSDSSSSLSLSVSLPSPVKTRLSRSKKRKKGDTGSDDGADSDDSSDCPPSPAKLVVLDDARPRPLRLSLGGSGDDDEQQTNTSPVSTTTVVTGDGRPPTGAVREQVAVEPGSLIPEHDDEVWQCSSSQFDESVSAFLDHLRGGGGADTANAGGDQQESIRFMANLNANQDSECAEELRREFKQEYFTQMKVIGQFNLGFIVAKLNNDLFLVDQHASDEKYNYEQLRANTTLKSQPLIIPQDLDLTGEEEEILMDHVDIFRANGFQFQIDAEKPTRSRVRLSAKPYSKNTELGVQDIHEIITLLRDRPGVMCRPSRIAQMLASRACRSSIMIGRALSKEQMETVLQHMSTMEQPFNCPHGRPTMRHMVNLSRLPNPNK